MAVELVTGFAGKPHVTAAQTAELNAGIVGAGTYILGGANACECKVTSANSVTIAPGTVLFEGRQVSIDATESLTIANGSQGRKRFDLVGIQYQKQSTGVESAALKVIKGAPGSTGQDPSYDTALITDGANASFKPLYRIALDGLSVGKPELLVQRLVPLAKVEERKEPKAINICGSSTSYAMVRDGVCAITLNDSWSMQANTPRVLGQLPEEYRPFKEIHQATMTHGNVWFRWEVRTTGEIVCMSTVTSDSMQRVNISYLTK